MVVSISNDLAWMKGVITDHVSCSCYTLRLWRPCRKKPWCLRAVHLQRLAFFHDTITFDLAMRGMTMKNSTHHARP